MRLVGYMSPTGYQYPPPESGPHGVVWVNVDPPRSILHLQMLVTDVKTPYRRMFYVVAGDTIIGRRQLLTDIDDWVAPSEVVQSIVANPSNAVVYVEAPPSTLPREYLPGGVVLNSGSIWAQLQPQPDGGANL
jgi:hypothetical protein